LESEKKFPLDYKLVAGLFILSGVSWFVSAAGEFFPAVGIIAGVLCIITGVGLLRRNHALWTAALVIIWLEILGLFVLLVIQGLVLLAAEAWLALAIFLLVFVVKLALSIWAYRVLIRPDVCACYYEA
jgi:hypothetical protein